MKYANPTAFRNTVINKGYDIDGYFGAQCWDAGQLFWRDMVGRNFITKPGGNGGARDCWEVSKKVNAGDEFELITDKSKLLPGDWVIFGGTKYGHVAMAVSKDLGGYVRLLGQNQGGNYYSEKSNDGSGNMVAGQGSCFNEVNFSLNNFLGAFRLKAWHKSKEKKDMVTAGMVKLIVRVYCGRAASAKELKKYTGKHTSQEFVNIVKKGFDTFGEAVKEAKNGTLDPKRFLVGEIRTVLKKPTTKK